MGGSVVREIKFRAWDKEKKVMFKIFDSITQTDWFLPYWKDKYEVMQYTGLKDKNGKEIYDSDICVSLDGLFLVVWNEEKAAFEMMFKEDGERLYFEEMWDDTKVIGNLYDNLALWEVV